MATATLAANLDRARVYRVLARLFRPPDLAGLEELRARDLPELRRALRQLAADGDLDRIAANVETLLSSADIDDLARAYQETFDASSGLRCVPNELAHTIDDPSREVTRTYELADVAGFYSAFGMEVVAGTERADHLAPELEFMQLLAVKEAVALGAEGEGEHAEVCRSASRAFLRDHLGVWVPRLAERLDEDAAHPLYAAAGRLLDRFLVFDGTACGAR